MLPLQAVISYNIRDISCFIFEANTAQSPYKKLKEALSSVEAFEKHYLVSMPYEYSMYTS